MPISAGDARRPEADDLLTRASRWTPVLLVAAAPLAAFAPVLSNGFVSYEDRFYILDNPLIRGLGPDALRAMLTATRGGLWQPLSWLSLAVDRSLWGTEAAGFHLTSLLLHAGTSVLFYLVCLRLLDGRRTAALLAALFFAVHPLRVESVAWASERKGLLSGFLFMAAVLAHLSGRGRTALAAFAASLAAKASALSLPPLLVVLDAWTARRRPTRKTLLALAPFFAVAAGALALAVLAGRASGTIVGPEHYGGARRASHVLYGLLFYPAKTLWPGNLSPFYPEPAWFAGRSWQLFACLAVLLAAAAALWRTRRSYPAVAAAFAAYAVMALPTAGFMHQGQFHAACDRYSYLSCLGFAVLFGAALGRGRARVLLAAAWLAALGSVSWRQCGVWRDSATLWSAASDRAPGLLARGELGAALLDAGETAEGIILLRAAIEDPAAPATVYVNLGAALANQGREAEARRVWRRGLAVAPSAELGALLGASLAGSDIRTATRLLEAALLAEPRRASWRVDLGDALARAGRGADARRQYDAALALEPGLGRAHNNLGLLLARGGETDSAVVHYRAALRDPASRVEAHHNLGNAHAAAGREREAERHYRAALRLDPAFTRSQVNLGNALARRGSFREAAALYRAALRTDPRAIEARANLGAIAPFLKNRVGGR
ncbi:MAG: tetratricopeptide repeat protein [Elusimicrobia bacterium]|nr:tetratricopeptide repeat protein [Elusimicrobiota bacterium]